MSAKNVVKIESDLQELIPDYLVRLKDQIALIKENCKLKDFEVTKSVSHKIKGSAGGYGLNQISILAGEIEDHSLKMNSHEIEIILTSMEEYLDHLEIIFVDVI